MTATWKIGAQLSTFHSPADTLTLGRLIARVESVSALLPLDFLILGSREIPSIFSGFCGATRPISEVYLWYNVLSDIPGMEESELVVNWRGERSRGWGGWSDKGSDVSETFRFACPNNPIARAKTLARLRELLTRYEFTGVFLDKIRFPSPANGFDELLCCFCEHCHRAADAVGLDLNSFRKVLADRTVVASPQGMPGRGSAWLDRLLAANPLIADFNRFRNDCITALVAEAHDEVRRLGQSVSLDLFSPGLASLVGQDYAALARLCDWAKPMTYRVAKGPAGLRLEIPSLVEGIVRHFQIGETQVVNWAVGHVRGFDGDSLVLTRNEAVPLAFITEEIAAAVEAMRSKPVYFGLELVSHPGVIEITPRLVESMVQAGRAANAAGLVISWDLMHAPSDGIRALAAATQDLRQA